jgi:hypothetical protein
LVLASKRKQKAGLDGESRRKALTIAFWNQITHCALAIRELVAPTYHPERHYMRGPGPACARREFVGDGDQSRIGPLGREIDDDEFLPERIDKPGETVDRPAEGLHRKATARR